MDSYIVRVYRRTGEAGHEVSGLVERVGNGGRKAFTNSEELWRFIIDKKIAGNKPAQAGRGAKRTRSV